jgi:hypothetical protein
MMRRLVVILAMAALLSATAAAETMAETMVERLLRVAGLTASPAQMRGPGDDIGVGDIWVASPGAAAPVALTSGSGYTSPIFSPIDGSILALKGEGVVRIPAAGGRVVAIQKAASVLKLVGFDGKNVDEVVVLLDGSGRSPLGVLSLTSGKVTPLPYDAKSDAERRILAQVRGQERVYGDASVYVKTESKAGLSRTIEWTDVYLRRGNAPPQNVSACDGVNCGQPALSPDGRRVAFVKSGA